MKKLLALALAGTMTLSLAACGGSKADTTTAAETTETTDTADAASTDGQTYSMRHWTQQHRASRTLS